MRYYVYHNRLHHRTIIHTDSCRFCTKGIKIPPIDRASFVYWYGPFETFAQAEEVAKATPVPLVRHCKGVLSGYV